MSLYYIMIAVRIVVMTVSCQFHVHFRTSYIYVCFMEVINPNSCHKIVYNYKPDTQYRNIR